MNAPEIITIEKNADGVACDGGGGALGHPKVWYSFDGLNAVECGYCDRLFQKKGTSGTGRAGPRVGESQPAQKSGQAHMAPEKPKKTSSAAKLKKSSVAKTAKKPAKTASKGKGTAKAATKPAAKKPKKATTKGKPAKDKTASKSKAKPKPTSKKSAKTGKSSKT